MSEELDRRAALAMGWKQIAEEPWFWVDNNGMAVLIGMEDDTWSPSTDRNDLVELLREVERRGLGDSLARKMRVLWMGDGRAATEWPINDYTFWLMILDPSRICEAACEVLEAANG